MNNDTEARIQYIKDRNSLIHIAVAHANEQARRDESDWNVIFHSTMDKLYADLKNKKQTKTGEDGQMKNAGIRKLNGMLIYANKKRKDTKIHYGDKGCDRFLCGKIATAEFAQTDEFSEATCLTCLKLLADWKARLYGKPEKQGEQSNEHPSAEHQLAESPVEKAIEKLDTTKQNLIEKINEKITFWTQLKSAIENGGNQ